MGTEILRPQDCLARQAPNLFPRRRFSPRPSPNPNHKLFGKASSQETRRRREGSPRPAKPQQQQKQLVMGQVTILKRGEPIEGTAARKEERSGADGKWAWDAAMFGTGRLGPEPSMIPKQIRVIRCRHDVGSVEDGYAGSAFSMSPSPTSLPLPSFSRGESTAAAFDRSATVGLRRLLRI